MALTLCPSRAELPIAPQRSIARNNRPRRNPRRLEPRPQGFDRPPDREDALVVFAARRIGAPEPQREDGELRPLLRVGVGGDGRPVDEVFDPQAGDLRAAVAAGSEGEKQGAASRLSASRPPEQAAISRSRISRVSAPALLRPRGAGGEAKRAAQVRRRKRARKAKPAVEGLPHGQAAAHGRWRMRTAGPHAPALAKRRLDRLWMPCEGSSARRVGS